MIDRPTVGLALGGGGARGLAHIGVLQVLENEGIPIDMLAGTSMGGFIAAAHATGMSASAMAEEACRMASMRRLLSLADPSLLRRGMLHGDKVTSYLTSLLGTCSFDDLQVPLSLISVDLNGRQEVLLDSGQVVDAVRATISVPGIFPPVAKGEQLLVDGGVLNNLPVDVVRAMGADIVIAVDVHSRLGVGPFSILGQRPYVPGDVAETLDYLWQSLDLMLSEMQRKRLAESRPDVLVLPSIRTEITSLAGFCDAAEIIAAGEMAAQEQMPYIQVQRFLRA